jgi:hypothetical protein
MELSDSLSSVSIIAIEGYESAERRTNTLAESGMSADMEC